MLSRSFKPAAWRRRHASAAAPPLVSLAVGIVLHALVTPTTPAADSATYNAIGAGLLGHHPYGPYYGAHWAAHGLAVRGVLVPLLIAFTYLVGGGVQPTAFEWIQAVVLVPATTYLIFVAGREAFSRRAGLIAAWLFALWLPAVWHTMWLLTETTLDLMLAGLLALLAGAMRRRSPWLAFAAGVVAGLIALSHAAYQVAPLLLLLILGVTSWHGASRLARTGVVVAGVLASTLLAVSHVGYGFPIVGVVLAAAWLFRRRRGQDLDLAAGLAVGVAIVLLPFSIIAATFGLAHFGQGAQGYGGGGGWTFYVGSRESTHWRPVPGDYPIGDLSAPGQLVQVGRRIDAGRLHVEPHLLAIIRKKLALPHPERQTLTDADYYRAGIENLLASGVGSWPSKVAANVGALFALPASMETYDHPPVFRSPPWWLRPWPIASIALSVLSGVALLWLVVRRPDRLILFVPAVFEVVLLMAAYVERRYVVPLWSSMFVLVGAMLAAALESMRARETRAASGRVASPPATTASAHPKSPG